MSQIDLAKRLRQMRLTPMAISLERRMASENMPRPVEEWLGQMLDAKENAQQIGRQEKARQRAGMPELADLLGIDYTWAQNFDETEIKRLSTCDWIKHRRRMLISGLSATGKTWLACAWGTQAIGRGLSVRYSDTMDLLDEWNEATIDKRLRQWREELSACHLLILDNLLTYKLNRRNAETLLRIIMDRENSGALIATSLYPIHEFHRQISEPMLAEQIADRFSSAHPLVLQGDSRRKPKVSRNVSPVRNKAASRNAGRVPNK
jgi:DNA replication protein DnaC